MTTIREHLTEIATAPPERFSVTFLHTMVKQAEAELRIADTRPTLTDVAEKLERLRLTNPLNGDGSNYMLDKVLKTLNVMAGNSDPGRAAELLRAQLDDERDARYCEEQGWPWPMNGKTLVERLLESRATEDDAA